MCHRNASKMQTICINKLKLIILRQTDTNNKKNIENCGETKTLKITEKKNYSVKIQTLYFSYYCRFCLPSIIIANEIY
jgi:hypothetical protein